MKVRMTVFLLACLLFIPTISFAQTFTARTLSDHGNVTVMEVSGNYDANNPDGTINAGPRESIAKEFFRLHKDDYDFLVVFSNFNFQMPAAEAKAFYLHIKNDTQGIGRPLIDNSALFGSSGQLQGIIDMGNIASLVTNPLDQKFEQTLSTLAHEQMHRWGAFVKFKDASGSIRSDLLGGGDHWSFLLNSYGSVLYGNQWQDNGNGTFTSIATTKYYSPLDLYLMGFLGKAEVPPMLLIENPSIDPARRPEIGATISGTARYLTIDDIIASEGERAPNAAASQKTFKTAFIFITTPGTYTGNELYGLENIRSGWQTRFSILTDGKGITEVSPTSVENVPSNPGIIPPTVTPRSLPPNIDDGMRWLMKSQMADGSWMDLSQTAERDTAEAVLVLKNFDTAQSNYQAGLQWLGGVNPDSTDYLSRKINAVVNAGQDATVLLNELISRKNDDGGWGSYKKYPSNPIDTSFVLKSLAKAGYSDQTVLSKAIEYLKSTQNTDGGWGSGDLSIIQSTANVLSAFNKYRGTYQLADRIATATAWLLQRQNPDGGFGSGGVNPAPTTTTSTVYDTALAVTALKEFDAPQDTLNGGLNYILNNQSGDGSWNESPYQTALAIEAVWNATVTPDLSIKSGDITFSPSSVNILPSLVTVNVNIANLGRTDVPQAKVALYDGAISAANKIGEQVVAFPGQSSVTVTFSVTVTDGNEHRFYIVVDPDNLVKESNKSNNTASKILYPQPTYDFEILSSNVSATPNPLDIFQDVTITSKVTNKGTMNAYNVQVKYYIDDPKTPLDIATATMDIPAGSTVTNQITWRANKPGVNLPLTVLVDPFNTFTELSKTNNKASTFLTVNGSTLPNLTISYKDIVITPSPVNQLGSVNISALVKNEGFSTAANIKVNFYKGTPGVDGVLIASRIIPSLNAGESITVSADWTNIMESGERVIYIKVDPDNSIKEIRKDDNDAFTTLRILSLPDLAISTSSITFSPPAPKDGDTVSINVMVLNKGEQGASNVAVKAYEGAALIGSQTIPVIAANSRTAATFIYNTKGKSGAHRITVIVDPDNLIVEQTKDNNTTSRTFGVQDARLWLTELYISPNGDGVKDTTQFFFGLDVAQTVKIVIVNERNKTVRTFSGPDLENVAGGNITWDGLDENGAVVDDGQYHIQVVDLNNTVLGSVLVTVDNNRSPITEAIGTKYLLNKNLTCNLPNSYDRWEWFPDESGIILSSTYLSQDALEYTTGLYAMTPDGGDILRLISWKWNSGSFPRYYIEDFKISPNGNRVAFVLTTSGSYYGADGYQLWVIDRDGRNSTLLNTSQKRLINIKWSPNGEYISYQGYPWPTELWIVKTDGTQKTLIEPSWNFYLDKVKWSPDSTRIAYDFLDSSYNETVRVSDINGGKVDIFAVRIAGAIEWLNNEKILYSASNRWDQGGLSLLDAGGKGSIKLRESGHGFFVSPDKSHFAFDVNSSGKAALMIADVSGKSDLLYESRKSGVRWQNPGIANFVRASDSSKIGFLEGLGYYGYPTTDINLVVVDTKTKSSKAIALPDSSLKLIKWFSDGKSILASGDYDRSLYSINVENGEITALAANIVIPMIYDDYYHWPFNYDIERIVSPYERYITYYKWDQTNTCTDRWNLWSTSSLLNLTADLRVVKDKSAVILKGIAADLNFEGYKLEYADIKSPSNWNPVAPPSDVPVIDDVFTMWVPPYEGNFYVRLTVWDKAGNIATSRKRVSWGYSAAITNLYKTTGIFSPNGDGVKDTVELHYTVLEPVHLEFNIYDANDNLIRTFLKDYTSPMDDVISWDGRDKSGGIVPNGKYKIKVFDYEFFVEVDNTPPDVGLHLSGLMQDFDINTGIGTLEIYTKLNGHAVDKNLKSWVIEYGEGDNPQQWYEYIRGEDQLIGKEKDGNPILNPIKDVSIEKIFDPYYIEWLVGKKLKIVAEDFAGNKSSAISDFLEETIILHKWDGLPIVVKPVEIGDIFLGPVIPAHLTKQGIHVLGGLETIRLPIVSMNVQFQDAVSGLWGDGALTLNPPSGVIDLKWDNSGLNEFRAVRIKAVDSSGLEHYSNVVPVNPGFAVDTCTFEGMNFLVEDLTLLKLQVRSAQDTRYAQWTDYAVFDSTKGNTIPVDSFDIAPPIGTIKPGMTYFFRMIGSGVSGKFYASPDGDKSTYPPPPGACRGLLTLSVNYNESDCNLLSDGKATLSARMGGSPSGLLFKTLKYYLQTPDTLQLLRQFDLTKEGWGSVTIDTLTLPEGSYPVKAVLTYSVAGGSKEEEASNTLVVDRVAPTAQITYPSKSLSLCPVKMTDVKGDWFGVSIEGKALDNRQLKWYELSYGVGGAPNIWLPAMTRVNGKDIAIAKKSPAQGGLGLWDVTDLKGTDFSLKLKVVDIAGNASCYTTSFSVDTLTEITNMTADKTLFSPNGDGMVDDVTLHYQIGEYATVDVKVFKALKAADGSYVLDQTPVRTIVSGLRHPGGEEWTAWDGKGDSGAVLPDGLYGIAVFAEDSCGNKNSKWVLAEIDNSPPTAFIAYPRPSDPLGTVVEIKGTVDDLHFKSYALEVGQGDSPAQWNMVSSGTTPINDNILGIWNTFGLSGRWTLRLSAVDAVANRNSATVTIDLGQRKTLISNLAAAPKLFSPNNDGKLDTTTISFSITDACRTEIDMLNSTGLVKKTFTSAAPSAGAYTSIWDGKDNTSAVVPDGAYTVKLHAALSSNPSVTQDESVTVVVDSTPPTVDITRPLNNSYFKDDVAVSGTISDANLLEYSISYTGDTGTALLDKASRNRVNYTFGVISGLPEGNYSLNVKAKDLGENITEKNIAFTIDRTPPKVTLDTPKEGGIYGLSNNIISITGSVVEKNLDSFSLRYGLGDNPSQWTELLGGNSVPIGPQLFSWKVGKSDGIPDGLYTLSLYAKDKVGQTGEARVKVMIDNNPPEAAISFPRDGGYVRAPADIKGTATDANFDKYTLELSEGQCAGAFKWVVMKASNAPVKDGTLASWQVLPGDGDYCLRLAAADKAGNKSEAKISVKVDTHPPAPPALSGKIENRVNARLTWTQNTEPDLLGYNLYRDSQKMNTSIIKDITYLDQNLKEGFFAYTVTALDLAGNESKPSSEVKLRVDLTPPDAKIRSPLDGSAVSGLVDIKGTAYSADDFKQYRVSIGQGPSPSAWNLIRTSPVPIPYGTLTQWDTLGLNGAYSIKLEAEDLTGNVNAQQITVTIDNTPPAAPLLLSAIPNGANVTLTWKANTETDLSGYVLFRNDQIANAPGIVKGDLKPYLVTGTTYIDKNLPDGKFKYYLIAMDQAGNLSDQSNTIEVTIDTHPPHAAITEPADRSKFEKKTLIRAESPDLDIAAVQFQYKKAQDTAWTNLGAIVTKTPYATYMDPVALGISYGDYNLRAIATDLGGKTDPSPSSITVTYTDLTAPDAPRDLKAQTSGADVTLTWTANIEPDLQGYNVYRSSGSSKSKINSSVVRDITYQDKGLSDGQYTYEITATDTFGNESRPSNSASAKIYAPVISQPYTPVAQKSIGVAGSNAAPSASVELLDQTSSGPAPAGAVNADGQGNFAFAGFGLVLGENRLTAKAKDSGGNISRASDTVVVVYDEPPAAPTGFAASVSGHDVSLTWNPNTESNLSGYNLYRNGVKVNAPVSMSTGIASASSVSYDYSTWSYAIASYAFDGNPSTSWMSDYSYGSFNPSWWELDLAAPELINHLEIHWVGNPILSYAGKDYEIQAWSGYAWITLQKITGNTDKDNVFDFRPSYRTNKLRIYIMDTTDTSYYKRVGISEVRILKDNLLTATSYNDLNLHDGRYDYKLTAVDYYGFESLPADGIKSAVGDVTPPAAPSGLTAAASGSEIILTWNPNTEPDLAGYNIYRNGPQGWMKINTSPITVTNFADANLKNGAYAYKITALDQTGNESLPSNEAAATVFVAPPSAPVNPRISPVPEGGALSVTWEFMGNPPAGFNVYRGVTAGGPYVKANKSLLAAAPYRDSGLTNGAIYFYVITAVDVLGNESAFSAEAKGIPMDTIPPQAPALLFPAAAGKPITLSRDVTDITGIAEPASTVELFKNGIPLRSATALGEDSSHAFNLDTGISGTAVSPDGRKVVYTKNGSIWLQVLSTGDMIQLIPQGASPVWSPEGDRLAYGYVDKGYNRIGLYDLRSGGSIALTDDTYKSEWNPSWAGDGIKIAFISNRAGSADVWVKDLKSGLLGRATSGVYPFYPKLSPDGNKLAYFNYQNLYVTNLLGNVSTLVDSSAVYASDAHDWSPDSGKLAYTSNRNGNSSLYVLEANTMNSSKLTNSTSYEYKPLWSPDGNYVASLRRSGTGYEFWVTPYQPGEGLLINKGLSYPDYILWLKSGGIAYQQQAALNITHLKGHFSFDNVQLDPGENIFYATAADLSGNVSRASEAISVIYDPGSLPDLEVTPDDIFIYPPYPKVGEQVAITVNVKNKGGVDAKDVDTEIYLLDSAGNLKLLHSEKIPLISSASEEVIGIIWDGSSKAGINNIVVSVDPNDTIKESDESNNYAMKEIAVVGDEKIIMTTTLDSRSYRSNQHLDINVNIKNPGIGRKAALSTFIEDENGAVVTALNAVNADLPYGLSQDFPFTWNTASTYAGSYRVHAVFKDAAANIIAENIVAFTILPDINIASLVVTDKTAYGPREDVSVTISTKNKGTNYIVPRLDVRVKVTDASNNILFTDDKNIVDLLPGTTVTLTSAWNTGLNLPGDYNVAVETYIDSAVIVSRSLSFKINTVMTIAGSVVVTPAVVPAGKTAQIDYTIQNTGNAAINGLPVILLIVDPETQAVMNTQADSIALAVNTTVNGRFSVSTKGYALKTYAAALQYTYQGNTKTVANSRFTVKDGTPPVVTVISPVSGSFYNSKVDLTVNATDDGSGVDRVEYEIDSGAWRTLAVSDPSSGRYATTWTPTIADNGLHKINFRATDKAGNTSIPVSVAFMIDTIPPVTTMAVGAPQYMSVDGKLYSTSTTTFTLSATDNLSGVAKTEYRLDSGQWATYAPFKLPAEGGHTISYRSTDNVGNIEAEKTLAVIVDNTPPVSTITVGTPQYQATGNLYISGITQISISAIDAGSGVKKIEYSIDSAPFGTYTTPITLASYAEGAHTITCRSIDNLGNTEADKTLTLILDKTPPETTISATDPLIAGVTNTVSPRTVFTLSAADNLSGVKEIRYRLDSGAWQTYSAGFSLAGLPAGAHTITYKATDNVLNEEPKKALTVRLIIIDITKGISLGPVVLVAARFPDDDENDNQEVKHNKDHNHEVKDKQSALADLINILTSSGIAYYIPKSEDDLKTSVRSGRHTAYLLIDFKDESLGREIKEAINYSAGLVFIKTRPDEDPEPDEEHTNLFGVKFTGKSAGKGLTVNIVQSPISSAGTLQTESGEKVVKTEITSKTAQALGYVTDKDRKTYPAIVYNKYGRGKVILFSFDLLNCPEQTKVEDLLRNSLNYVTPDEHYLSALDSVPLSIKLSNSIEPVDVKVTETIPSGTTADTAIPQAIQTDNTILWRKSLNPNEKAKFGYYLNLPDLKGDYTTTTEVKYSNNGDYRLYGIKDLTITVPYSSAESLQTIIAELNTIAPSSKKDAERIEEAIEHLHEIKTNASNRKQAEENIEKILEAIEEIRKLSFDASEIRLKLDEMLKIWGKKWYQTGKWKSNSYKTARRMP